MPGGVSARSSRGLSGFWGGRRGGSKVGVSSEGEERGGGDAKN